jgi:putative ABC transport system permease protein
MKAFVRVGADVAVPIPDTLVPELPASTVVVDHAGHSVSTGREVLVHAVDPATFARGAYWSGSFASQPLDALMSDLETASGTRVPVVVAGAGVDDDATLELGGVAIPVRVAARTSQLPGTPPGGAAVVLASRSLLDARGHGLREEGAGMLWARGDPVAILDRLRAEHVPTRAAVTSASVARTPSFLAVSWTFDFLEAIGAVTSVVAILGVLLYLQARQREREVSYALASRMGLTAGVHRRSVFLEVLAMLVAAFVIAVGLAVVAALLVMGKLDVLPSAPPPPSFRIPVGLIGVTAAAVVVVSAAGAWAVQRQAGRARVAEVLRLAT